MFVSPAAAEEKHQPPFIDDPLYKKTRPHQLLLIRQAASSRGIIKLPSSEPSQTPTNLTTS